MYYFSHGGEFGISPSIPQLLALGAPTDLDHAALSAFLWFGSFLGEDTAFSGIRALPPNATLEWQEGELHVAGGAVVRGPARISRREALAAYVELFRTAMHRRRPGNAKVIVPLSGGGDSRHIFLELCASVGPPALAATVRYWQPRPGDDVEVASMLARALDVPHLVLDQSRSTFEAVLRTHREMGFCGLLPQWAFVLADHLRGQNAVIYDGIGGDVLSAALFVTDRRLALFANGRFRELAWDLLDRPFPAGIFRREVSRTISYAAARDRLVPELEQHAHAANPVGSFFFWNRTRRYISLSPNRVLSAVATVFSPYLDHQLYDLLATLPIDLIRDGTFHTDAIRAAYPEWSEIPYAEKTVSATRDRRYLSRFARKTARYAVASLPSELVSSRYVLTRVLRLLTDPLYAPAIDWLGPVVLYLLRLDRARRTSTL